MTGVGVDAYFTPVLDFSQKEYLRMAVRTAVWGYSGEKSEF